MRKYFTCGDLKIIAKYTDNFTVPIHEKGRKRRIKMSKLLNEARQKIGDGKFPNYYWVFQYDVKHKRVKENGFTEIVPIEEGKEEKNNLLGKFKTFQEALECVDNKAYLPNVVIEDRLSGQVFEQMCITCQECGKEEWESNRDIKFTQEAMEKAGYKFE